MKLATNLILAIMVNVCISCDNTGYFELGTYEKAESAGDKLICTPVFFYEKCTQRDVYFFPWFFQCIKMQISIGKGGVYANQSMVVI